MDKELTKHPPKFTAFLVLNIIQLVDGGANDGEDEILTILISSTIHGTSL